MNYIAKRNVKLFRENRARIVLTLFATVFLVSSVSANEISESAAVESASVDWEAVPLTHRGSKGVWFPLDMARDILSDVEELRLLQSKIGFMEEQLLTRKLRIEDLNLAIDLSVVAEDRAIKAMEAALEAQILMESKKDAWYRHPALWVTVGVVLTVGLEIGAYKIFEAVE